MKSKDVSSLNVTSFAYDTRVYNISQSINCDILQADRNYIYTWAILIIICYLILKELTISL